jgi:hypothetical protein
VVFQRAPPALLCVGLANIAQRSDHRVPYIISSCIEAVEERGLTAVNIYCQRGHEEKVEQLVSLFEDLDTRYNCDFENLDTLA